MKKNIQINLFGTLYNIDEDACQLLENYLESMRRYFSTREGGAEIADDIEHRVAELLWQRKAAGMVAVDNDVIREIISQIGNPEEIGDQEADAQPSSNGTRGYQGYGAGADGNGTTGDGNETSGTEDLKSAFEKAASGAQKTAQEAYEKVRNNTRGKRLFRNPNDKILGGVCSGLAKYFGGDVTLWRIVLVALFLFHGVGLIAYIIMWFLLPVARTPEDRLRMNGEAVSPDTINSQILRDQTTKPVAHDNAGCFKAFFSIALLIVAVPIIIGLVASVIGVAVGGFVGVTGGIVGAIGKVLEGLFSVFASLFDFAFSGFPSGYWGWEILPSGNTDYIFWRGIILLLVGIALFFYASIRGNRKESAPFSFVAKVLLAVIIVLCLLSGLRDIMRCENNLYWFKDKQWFSTKVSNIVSEESAIDFSDGVEKFNENMKKLPKELTNRAIEFLLLK